MLRSYFLLIVILFLSSACGTMQRHTAYNGVYGSGDAAANPYLQQIVNWQGRLARESYSTLQYKELALWKSRIASTGWNSEMVQTIVAESKALTSYEMEIEDRWDTPKEFIEKSFHGDCEDIAIFIMANLRSLEYPYAVRVLAVKTNFEDHALVKIQMPDLSWQVFETVQTGAEDGLQLVYTPIVEFDEKEIFTHAAM